MRASVHTTTTKKTYSASTWRRQTASKSPPELYEVGPDEGRTEERHHEFGDGCVCRHGPPPNLCEESLQSKFSDVKVRHNRDKLTSGLRSPQEGTTGLRIFLPHSLVSDCIHGGVIQELS